MSDKEKVFCMPYIHCIQPSMIMLFWVKLTGYWPHSVFVFMALTASWPKNTHKKTQCNRQYISSHLALTLEKVGQFF